MASWTSSLRRKAQSGWESMKKFSVRTAGAAGVAEEGEAGFQVGVAVGVVGAEAFAGEGGLGGVVEGGGEGIGPGVATGGVGAPAGGVVPAVAVAGGVGMDGDDDDVVLAELAAPGVHAAAALLQGDVFALGNYQLNIEAQGGEAFPDEEGEVAVVGIFAEVAVGAALAGRVKAVAVVEEDFHSCCLDSDSKLGRICGNSECGNFQLSLPQQAQSLCKKSVWPRPGDWRGLLLFLEEYSPYVVSLW